MLLSAQWIDEIFRGTLVAFCFFFKYTPTMPRNSLAGENYWYIIKQRDGLLGSENQNIMWHLINKEGDALR